MLKFASGYPLRNIASDTGVEWQQLYLFKHLTSLWSTFLHHSASSPDRRPLLVVSRWTSLLSLIGYTLSVCHELPWGAWTYPACTTRGQLFTSHTRIRPISTACFLLQLHVTELTSYGWKQNSQTQRHARLYGVGVDQRLVVDGPGSLCCQLGWEVTIGCRKTLVVVVRYVVLAGEAALCGGRGCLGALGCWEIREQQITHIQI